MKQTRKTPLRKKLKLINNPFIDLTNLFFFLFLLLIMHIICIYFLEVDITDNAIFNLISSATGYILGQVIPSGSNDDEEENKIT